MKKKIAVFANTYNSDIITSFLEGFERALPKKKFDTFIFLAANSYAKPDEINLSETSIHDFPNLEDFDFAIVFSQGLNSNEDRKKIYKRCEEAKIPTFCIGDEHPGFYGMLISNEKAMLDLCEHMYTEHNVRKVTFIAGPKENDDSNKRLEAVKKFLKKKKLSIKKEDICYSDWEVRKCMDFLTDKYGDSDEKPDAIICANDFLSVSATMALDRMNYPCPEKCLVTGFDYAKSGKTYYPSIATVDQRFDVMGEDCVKSIKALLKGEEVPAVQHIESRFIPGESCGCINPRNDDKLRKVHCHNLIGHEYEQNNREGLIYAIRSAFQESNRFSTLPQKLQEVFYISRNAEVQSIYIMLDPTLERIATEDIDKLPKYKYSDKLQVVVARKDGQPLDIMQMKKDELIPGYDGKGDNKIYFMLPLYVSSFVVGYFVMLKNESGLRDWVYGQYESCMIQSLTYYKTNIRLTALNDKLSELMQTDALTSLKNRNAFENAKNMLKNQYLAQDGNRFAAVMFDLNDLKKINDELGHGAGDIYIKNSSELICNTFKHSPVFRIGGDEFVAIVKNSDYPERDKLLAQFRADVKRLSKENLPPIQRISIASGMADFDEIENDDIETLFKKADDRMYENKRKMKAQRK